MASIPVKLYAYYAFDVLYSKLKHVEPIPFEELHQLLYPNLAIPKEESYPIFVTWNRIKFNNEKELRGCIGNFSDLTLPKGVMEYSLISGLQDTRFEPINKTELKFLSCSVTILKNFEKVKDLKDWEIGKHGIKILINGNRSATFLPEVAVEQHWDKDETLTNLVRKAGYNVRSWNEMADIELTRYQGEKASVSFKEFELIRIEEREKEFSSA